jgi:DNA polymerase-1
VTGRFSSDNPNVQQIPGRGNGAELRKCFVASPGYKMICADYSQIELRILAELSQEKALVHAYQNHIDIHAQTASIAFGIPLDEVTGDQRKIAKIINFATIYGGGPQAISKGLLQVISEDEARTILQNQFKRHPKVSKHGAYYDLAKEFIASYFQGLPNAKDYLEKSGNNAVYNRYSETPLGRKRFYPELDNESLPKEQRLEEAEGVKRKGKNHAIQGCSADITKVAIIRIGQYFEQHPEFGGRILLTVHDEIATEVYQDVADDFLAIQKRLMIEAGETFLKTVPVEVDAKISDYWEK